MTMKVTGALNPIGIAIMVLAKSRLYVALAFGVAAIFWIAFNMLDQLLFFSPFWDFYLPNDAVPSFILSNIIAALMGLVVSMNVYIIRSLKLKKISASMFSGTSVGMISGACASCTSLSFLLISTFGGVGAVASSVLSTFQIPLRLLSIGLLVWALYSTSKRLTASCVLPKSSKLLS
jgi:hypothetical protein